ncbi:isoprenoid biosynthesis glyoxalase ElbB [Magnetospirillum molischianum]|uniref:Enhancing lycopene biosynthesis protein 2 n=1 Tax=Magnetospirillum molischianum DSM 120 TaxID=1150626 RepID=H8FTT3_MAGML|nr:isoprenoid biosynthesis glyoxalase ElbB [Magnetospirillum molischianum]CCG41790.1 Enhancing lycopene biosynthesis protein 2 [Magnetospirillum molischianum DSM 120]
MSAQPRFAVILSGCGVFDGTEIHESVLTLLAIDRLGGVYRCYAPDRDQLHVVNHRTGTVVPDETRNVLVESARIARGTITDLAEFDPEECDALILPGGFGAAKNLCGFAIDGPGCAVDAPTERAIRLMLAAKKPIGALCIAPALLARVIGDGIDVTIGNDSGTAAAIDAMGAHHRIAGPGEVVIDATHKIATSPCYMLDSSIGTIATGAENTVRALLTLMGR